MMKFEIKNENEALIGVFNGRLDSAVADQLEKRCSP